MDVGVCLKAWGEILCSLLVDWVSAHLEDLHLAHAVWVISENMLHSLTVLGLELAVGQVKIDDLLGKELKGAWPFLLTKLEHLEAFGEDSLDLAVLDV